MKETLKIILLSAFIGLAVALTINCAVIIYTIWKHTF